MAPLVLTPGRLSLPALRAVWADGPPLAIDPAARPRVDAAAATIARVLAHGDIVYGVNTGFGLLARTNNTLIVPSNVSDMAGLIATAMSVVKAEQR